MEEPSAFSAVQKEYLAGFFAGIASGKQLPFAGLEPPDETFFGSSLAELCKEEQWKRECDPLDIWDRIVACSVTGAPPEGADVFRFKYHGLFYVAPAQDSFMLRVRVPGNALTSRQLTGLAEIADDWGGGYGDVTTRGNVQLRELRPRHVVDVLMKLHDLGLVSRGAGADNVRNITATPTSGFDPTEIYDVRPLANALQFCILNSRELYGLPRKFNLSFDSGGSVSVVADTNDIAFLARRVAPGRSLEPGVYFRVALAGITGHRQFAADAGIALLPEECVAVAVAMLRVYRENGDRTNRKKARLKYLIDRWGIERFLAETERKLAFPLRRCEEGVCEPRSPVVPHGHLGVRRQKQPGLNSVGVSIPVGRMNAEQMRGVAEIARVHGSGTLRTTVWQSVIVPDVPDELVGAAKEAVAAAGFSHEASAVAGGIVACTGNTGCKFSATDTKGHALALGAYLEPRVQLDRPINVHLTGCPNSCAQHYVGDIGLLGVTVTIDGCSTEAYNVVVGGGSDDRAALARDLFQGVPAAQLPVLIEQMLAAYARGRSGAESFAEFVRRQDVAGLRSSFDVRTGR